MQVASQSCKHKPSKVQRVNPTSWCCGSAGLRHTIRRRRRGVSIILETFSNKAHGMKLNALDYSFGSFCDDNWAKKVTARVSDKKDSILQVLTRRILSQGLL
jgi:hypothetical protein